MSASKIHVGDSVGVRQVIKEARSPNGRRKLIVRCKCGREDTLYPSNISPNGCLSCRAKDNIAARRKSLRKNKGIPEDVSSNATNRFNSYKVSAKHRGLDFKLSFLQYHEITQKDCFYCGVPPSNKYELRYPKGHPKEGDPRGGDPYIYNGIDRIDSSIGYIMGNVVPCCAQCNRAKGDCSAREFLSWLHKAYAHTAPLRALIDRSDTW